MISRYQVLFSDIYRSGSQGLRDVSDWLAFLKRESVFDHGSWRLPESWSKELFTIDSHVHTVFVN